MIFNAGYDIQRRVFPSLIESLILSQRRALPASFSLFAGKEFGRGYVEAGRMQTSNFEQKPVEERMLTDVLLVVNVLVYAAQIATQGKLLLWGAKVNSLIRKGQLWRLATSALLHANIGHLMINCYSLNSIGPTVEQLTGSHRFLAIYFSSAIASSFMSYRFSQSPSIGASGAIFGLVGSHAVFVLRHRNLVGGAEEDLLHVAHVIALNMAIGFLSQGIDNWGHLGDCSEGLVHRGFLVRHGSMCRERPTEEPCLPTELLFISSSTEDCDGMKNK